MYDIMEDSFRGRIKAEERILEISGTVESAVRDHYINKVKTGISEDDEEILEENSLLGEM